MIKVITYGTFDVLHVGHVNLLCSAKALGTHLTVAVSTDVFNAKKGKTALYPFDQRVEVVRSIRYVDHVISESDWGQKPDDILNHGIHTFVIGDDWAGKFDYLNQYCNVVYLPRTPGVSSTITRDFL